MKRNLLLILFVVSVVKLSAQTKEDNLVQFSGVVLTSDSLNPVSYATIIIKEHKSKVLKGTAADYYGFFSFVAHKKDTICFSSVGFKSAYYTIPDTITERRYSIIQLMTEDTIFLSGTVIYPYPSWDDFKDVFLNLDIPDDDITIAQKNIEKAKLREAGMAYIGTDATASYRSITNNRAAALYNVVGVPSNNLLNPFAWAKFIKAWKEGKFKRNKELLEEVKRQKESEKKRRNYEEWLEKE